MSFEIRTRVNIHGKTIRERFYPVTCHCGRIRWLRKKDMDSSECFHCSQARKGIKGFEAALKTLYRKYGEGARDELMSRIAKEASDARPQPSELQFMRHLIGLPFERNTILPDTDRRWIADFLVAGQIVFEVNGGCHRMKRDIDTKKYVDILKHGYSLVVMEDDDLDRDWLLKGLMA